MSEVTVSSILYLLFTILFGFIAIPLCMYSIVQFYKYKDDRRFKKRHGRLSTFTALCFVGELFSGCLLTLAFSGFASTSITIALAWIGDILNFVSYFLIIHCLVLRFWCLYYDIRYQVSTADNIWKSLIDEHFVINEEHLNQVKSFDIDDDLWFIKNKPKQGNAKWMLKVWFMRSFVTIVILLSIMILIEMIFNVGLRRGVIEVIFTLLFFIPWFFMIWIYHRIPQFHDTYFIRREIVVIHNIDLIDVLASAIVSIVANYGVYTANMSGNNSNTNPYSLILENDYLNVLMIITFYVMGVSHMIIIYIMTFWVRHKIDQDEEHITTLQQRTTEQAHIYMSFIDILQHQYGYELFMDHLSSEFSIENLLSLTEFMQYKCMIKQTHEIDIELEINLPMKYIPRSTIVYGKNAHHLDSNSGHDQRRPTLGTGGVKTKTNETEEVEKKDESEYGKIIYKLYYKYIRSAGELEINVSWQTRSTFAQYIDNDNQTVHTNILLNDSEYFSIFDECIAELLRLMKNDSYARFTHTPKYQQLSEAIQQD